MVNSELSDLIDVYGLKRAERLAAKHVMDELEVEEKKLKAEVIQAMIKAKATSHGGKKYGVNYKRKDKPTAGDWPKIYEWIAQNDGWDILQKRLTESAVEARREDGIVIPGIVMFQVDDVTIFTP